MVWFHVYEMLLDRWVELGRLSFNAVPRTGEFISHGSVHYMVTFVEHGALPKGQDILGVRRVPDPSVVPTLVKEELAASNR